MNEPSRLAARAERLGPSFDLLAGYEPGGVFMEREGLGVSGAGDATGWVVDFSADGRRHHREAILSSLDGIRAGDRDAPLPIAFGSIPFDPLRVSTFIVPSRLIRRDGAGETWLIDVAGPGSESMTFEPRRATWGGGPANPFSSMQLRAVPLPDRYTRAVKEAVERIGRGELRKVVLARSIEVAAGRRLQPKQLLARLRAVEPGCYAFAVPTGSGRTLVGATPELLVSRFGREVRANPLAGSAPRSGDSGQDRANAAELASSAKNLEEHAIVVEAVAATLEPICDELTFDREPTLVETANVWHLSTHFTGTLAEPAPTVVELVDLLHPTPAVGGEPRDAALRAIAELEPIDRNGYAGPVGWMDAAGDGVWALALRCAELRGDIARLFAGAGIVSGSSPESELEETERKFQAFLDSLRWG